MPGKVYKGRRIKLTKLDLHQLGSAFGNGTNPKLPKEIPAAFVWGLVVLTLSLLTGTQVYFGRRRSVRTVG